MATCILCGDGVSAAFASTPAPCCCSMCPGCVENSAATALATTPHVEGELYSKGQSVQYRSREGIFLPAKIEVVDKTCDPPQYGIRLPGADSLRFTEGPRLLALPEVPSVQCPSCSTPYTSQDVRRLAPVASEAAAQRVHQAQQHMFKTKGVSRCPHGGCGVLFKPQAPPDDEDGNPVPVPLGGPRCPGCAKPVKL